MDYLLLGPMVVARGDHPVALGGLRQRAVLAALLLAANRTVDIDKLIEQVWDDNPPAKPVASLRAYVANLRRILDDAAPRPVRLITDARGYRLSLGDDRLDTKEFESLVGDGTRLLAASDAAGSSRVLQRALELWRGTPLAEFHDQPFVYHEVHRLEALRADAVEARFEAQLRLGRSADLISEMETEVASNPMRERLWGQLMLAMYRAGRRADALSAYERLHLVLDHELGVRPSLVLERLAGEIRNESTDLDWQPTQTRIALGQQKTHRASELFGRSRELDRLSVALTHASGGRGAVAVLTGESGVGKTALASELADLADSMGMATAWAGHSGGTRKPLSWGWTQALRGLAGKGGQQRSDAASGALLPGWWDQRSDQLSAEDAESQMGFDFIQATAAAVNELANRWPALIVLDDLHRADRFTLDVLELLSASIVRTPMLILATWQDGGVDRPLRTKAFDRLLSRSDMLTMKLRGIDPAATADLIERVCGVTPNPDLVHAVGSRTGGNPFYIGELTRLLHDTGQLDDATRDIFGDDVPDAVSGVIRRRMADLPKATRNALSAAAVLGIEFSVSRLAPALGVQGADGAAMLESALGAGLLGESPGQPGRYRFSHGLVRDAVAAQVTGVARARLHADIARVYAGETDPVASEDAFGGADHAWRAGDELEPAVALRLMDRALADAWARSAYQEVADLDRRALAVCGRLPANTQRFDREADLWLQLASVEAVVNGQTSAEVLDALQRASEIGPQTEHFTSAVAMRCLEACGSGRYHEAAVLADSLIAFYDRTGHPIAGSAGYYIRGLVEFMRGRLDESLISVGRLQDEVPSVSGEEYGALAAFEVLSYGVAGHAHAMRGDLDSARKSIADGIALGAARNDGFGSAVVRMCDIQLDAMTGSFAGVAERADEVSAELTQLGVDQFMGGAQLIAGWARGMGPEVVDTADQVRAAIAQHSAGGRRIFSPLYLGLLSDVEAAHGSPAAALSALDKAEQIAAATGERVWNAQLSTRRLRLHADSYRSGTANGAVRA